MNDFFTQLMIDTIGLSFFHLGLIFIFPFLIILVIYELYTLIKSNENK